MSHSAAFPATKPKTDLMTSSDARELARAALEDMRRSLPSQGPIDVFIHHNTLHLFEDLPFETAVEEDARQRHAKPYLTHAEFLQHVASGRIDWGDVDLALDLEEDERIQEILAKDRHLAHLALQIQTQTHTRDSLRWALAEGDWLRAYAPECPETARAHVEASALRHLEELLAARDDQTLAALLQDPATGATPQILKTLRWDQPEAAIRSLNKESDRRFALKMLWNALSQRMTQEALPATARLRVKDTPPDGPSSVDAATIAIVAAYLDRGHARWRMPVDRDGMLAAAMRLLGPGERCLPESLRWLPQRHWIAKEPIGGDSVAVVARLLERLGVDPAGWKRFLWDEIQTVSGWAGLVSFLERRGTPLESGLPSPTLAEFVALRLILRCAMKTDAKNVACDEDQERQNAYAELKRQAFVLCQLSGKGSHEVLKLTQEEFERLVGTLAIMDDISRRRILQRAYERTFQRRMLNAVLNQPAPSKGQPARPSFQAVFCLDEREESLRRYLEEAQPTCATYGAAGFFNVAIYYASERTGTAPAALCPIVVTPRHTVVERRTGAPNRKRKLGFDGLVRHTLRVLHQSSRRLIAGQILSTGAGLLAAWPLAARIMFPRVSISATKKLLQPWGPPKSGPLTILRESVHAVRGEGPQIGFEPTEMADRVEGLLRSIGLSRDFARLVFFIGHGATTVNNPFASAYECGACGGHRGDRNGRVLAMMANRADVRAILRERGITIPDDTHFVGGCHDTCTDAIDLFDLDDVPATHAADFKAARQTMDRALALNAHERTRRFDDARGLEPHAALRHVQARAVSIREPRPEYGHGTNAWCYVGPRASTMGLFLDRRCFLTSYEPKDDPDGSILEATLAAAVPVCAGINLEYYFSRVDNQRYGAGTKLPHNVAGLIGVMDGYLSDLRTGLPWQTVEIHEPMRLFVVVETKPETLTQAVNRIPGVRRLVLNRWIHVAVLDPETRAVQWFDGERFEPFTDSVTRLKAVPSSRAYYEGRSEHLWPVRIVPGGLAT